MEAVKESTLSGSAGEPEEKRLLAEQRDALTRLKEATDMFGPGRGFGDPDAERDARMEIDAARYEYERVTSELSSLSDRNVAELSLKLQRHQVVTAWLAVAVAVVAAVPGVIALLR